MNDINNLGSFSSIDAVWSKYPEGGREGDFLTINGVKHRWNKYAEIWENADTVTSSTARPLETIDGDLTVQNDLTVGGVIRAKALKQPNCGLFETLEALKAKYPNPEVGMWATVGNTIPATVYLCAEEGVWKNTGQTGGIDSLDWSRISTIEGNVSTLRSDVDAIKESNTALKGDVDAIKESNTALKGDVATLQKESGEHSEAIASCLATLTEHEKRLIKTVAFADLDTLTDPVASVGIYSVTANRVPRMVVGLLLVHSDDGGHQVTQTLFSNHTAGEDGTMDGSAHSDTSSTISTRHYNVSSATLTSAGTPVGSWTAWTQLTAHELYDALSSLHTATSELRQNMETLRGDLDGEVTTREEATEKLTSDNRAHHTVRFGGIVTGSITITQVGLSGSFSYKDVWFSEKDGIFVLRQSGKYYNVWSEYEDYMDGMTPHTEKQYVLDDKIYMYDSNSGELKQIGGSSVSSIFNATIEVPISGFYVLCDAENAGRSAVHAAWKAKKGASGLIISFEVGAGVWKTYQYIGKTVTEGNWTNTDNWKDFGSLAAGSETYVIIDQLCGTPVAGEYYTLATAVTRLIDYQKDTGVTYAKKGLIISYRTGENTMETKQFQGEVSGFGEIGLWKDFGGGSKVETSDTPKKDGKDALSTGGAYTHMPVGINVDTETEGVIKLKLVNEGGVDVGDEVQFNVGTGSGGGTGTTIAVAFKENPFYGKAGGSFIVKAAIMSVTKAGSQESSNAIMSVNFVNRTTKSTVAFFSPRKQSSATLSDYSFEFDLSSLATSAGELPLQAVITDDGGNTATKNLSVIAIDVTCESVQTLNYTKETSLKVGGPKTSIPMYRFPNNASELGISTKVEMLKNGVWETIQETVVRDTYPHNVSIDPTGLTHGAYPIRIQGTDVASGTKGNMLHTAVMVIEQQEDSPDYNKPIVVARWNDDTDGSVRLFESVSVDVACYQRETQTPTVVVSVSDKNTGTKEQLAERVMYRNKYYTMEKRIVGYSQGDTLVFDATCGEVALVEKREVSINGSLLAIAETEGAFYKISMAGRSNSDTDKSIKVRATDGTEREIVVHGSNYSSNGFVEDTFGTEQANGRMSLRIAEDVTAECTDKPFDSTSIPTNGLALSLTFKVKNIAQRNARIMKCMSDRLGFVLTGEKFIVTTNGDSDEALSNVQTTAATSYLDDVVYRFDIVIEPQAQAPYSGIMTCKVYQNGDMAAMVPIDVSNSFPKFDDIIHFDGTDADLYLYEVTRWNTYYDFIQAFNNYLVNLTDTQAMLTEYEQNQVMVDTTAEGTTKPRPDMQKLLDRGVMVCVRTRTKDANLSKDGSPVTDSDSYYPDYTENIKDKKTSVLVDWYLYFPDRPWANVKIEALPETNQGTSTLAYAIKNKKGKIKKAKRVVMLYTREEISKMYNGDETILAMYDDAAALAAKKKIRIREGSTPVQTITIKVDYSDSAGANNCALMEQMNDVQIALGKNYMTPAQVFNTDKNEELHTSIDGITCAMFRTDYRIGQEKGAEAATLPENAYFHSKANFNVDKGNPHFFGFEDVAGYNKGCVNYGDFKEIVTPKGTDIDAHKRAVLADPSKLAPGTLYMISEYCGPKTRFIENDGTGQMTETDAVADFKAVEKTGAEIASDDVKNYDWASVYRSSDGKYYKYTGGAWKDTTGSMTYDNGTGKWVITGRVLNPVECYEYRQYQEFCWQQGVNSVDDMMKPLRTDDGEVPVWTTYYEMRYPDDDDLNALYASGKKVPYQLYRELSFCQQCNQNLTDNAEENAAKNPDGSEKVFNGAGASTTITLEGKTVAGTKANRLLKWQREMHTIYNPYSANYYTVVTDYKATVDQRAKNMMKAVYLETDGKMRFYFNHGYDGDSVDGADNDCYLTIPWDMDGSNSHLYQGWDGVMFQQSFALFNKGEGVWIDSTGTQLTLHDTAAAMRSSKTRTGLEIFSASGSYRYWMTNRILKWPKVVSSFDGQRKYVETATAADNHFPALHGLRLDSLPAFQRKRFAYRDGYYQTGDLFKHFFQARMMGRITVRITAAQDGYFGMGVDSTSNAKYSCYLKAGESHTFTEAATGVGGKLIYIFGADKIGTLDLSGCTPKNSNWMIGDCTLLRRLIIGGEGYEPSYTDDILSALNLGQMPFLEEIDIRNTKIQTLNASGCPRLTAVEADGSELRTITLAQSSRIDTLSVPSTLTTLDFVSIPNLAYTGLNASAGFRIPSMKDVTRVRIENTPNFNVPRIIADVLATRKAAWNLRVADQKLEGDGQELISLVRADVGGIDVSGNTQDKPVISGTYNLTAILEETEMTAIEKGIDELTLFTGILAYIHNISWYLGGEYAAIGGANPTEDTINDWYMYYNGETYDEYAARELGTSGTDGYNDADISTFIDMTAEDIVKKYGQWNLVYLSKTA